MDVGTFKAVMFLCFFLGCYITYIGYVTSVWLGYVWTDSLADYPWGFSSYIFVPAKISLQLYGIWSLWAGGLLAGVLTQLLYHGSHLKIAIVFMLGAVFFASLGFNTLDWMLARAFGTNEQWSPWMIGLTNVTFDSWTFYILFSILPLFFGGYLIGLALMGAALK
jgi:hypothetical protein